MLSKDWLTEKHIDFEYKKYVLLAYFAEVDKHFELNCLYPDLSELIEHYKTVALLRENSEQLKDAFPKRLIQIDANQFKLSYQQLVADDNLMQELLAIIDYSLPRFRHYLEEGKKIYDFIERQLHLHQFGITPLNKDAGYLMLKNATAETLVYRYCITIFQQAQEKYRGINFDYVTKFRSSINNTFEGIKSKLILKFPDLPNPATFAIEATMQVPLEATLLPIAKRMLVKQVA